MSTDKTISAIIGGGCFVLMAAIVLGLVVGQLSAQTAVVELPASSPAWRQGEPPVDQPVVGLWLYEGELVTMAVIRSEFAGLYEYSLVGRQVRPLPTPDYWAPMPEVQP